MRIFSLLLISFYLCFQANAQTLNTELVKVQATQIAKFSHPWGMAQLPNKQILVTERGGKLWLVDPIKKAKIQIAGLPKIAVGGQSGLLDIAIAPDFETSNRIFFSFGKFIGSRGAGTAIASAILQLKGKPKLENVQTIFEMNNPSNAGQHFGSRIVIAKDGTMFFTIGDRGEPERAQDPFDHAGSVLRVNQDGSVPKDNPYVDTNNGAPEIWSIGHRNPQGAALNPKTGILFTVEHGARGGDEINIPEAGKNYGWPVISYGTHYSGAKIGVGTKKHGMEQPEFFWDPSIAPSGMAFYQGNLFPKWKDSLFVGALKDQKLVRLTLNSGKYNAVENLFEERFGRIRDVRFFSNGNMWLLSDEDPGQLIRISPAQ